MADTTNIKISKSKEEKIKDKTITTESKSDEVVSKLLKEHNKLLEGQTKLLEKILKETQKTRESLAKRKSGGSGKPPSKINDSLGNNTDSDDKSGNDKNNIKKPDSKDKRFAKSTLLSLITGGLINPAIADAFIFQGPGKALGNAIGTGISKLRNRKDESNKKDNNTSNDEQIDKPKSPNAGKTKKNKDSILNKAAKQQLDGDNYSDKTSKGAAENQHKNSLLGKLDKIIDHLSIISKKPKDKKKEEKKGGIFSKLWELFKTLLGFAGTIGKTIFGGLGKLGKAALGFGLGGFGLKKIFNTLKGNTPEPIQTLDYKAKNKKPKIKNPAKNTNITKEVASEVDKTKSSKQKATKTAEKQNIKNSAKPKKTPKVKPAPKAEKITTLQDVVKKPVEKTPPKVETKPAKIQKTTRLNTVTKSSTSTATPTTMENATPKSSGTKATNKSITKAAAKNTIKKTGTKSIAKTATKKAATKAGAKALGKSALKKIPIVGALAGLGFAYSRAKEGDWSGAGLEALSGILGSIPGLGTGASMAIDAGLMARDIKNADTAGIAKEQVDSVSNNINQTLIGDNIGKALNMPVKIDQCPIYTENAYLAMEGNMSNMNSAGLLSQFINNYNTTTNQTPINNVVQQNISVNQTPSVYGSGPVTQTLGR